MLPLTPGAGRRLGRPARGPRPARPILAAGRAPTPRRRPWPCAGRPADRLVRELRGQRDFQYVEVRRGATQPASGEAAAGLAVAAELAGPQHTNGGRASLGRVFLRPAGGGAGMRGAEAAASGHYPRFLARAGAARCIRPDRPGKHSRAGFPGDALPRPGSRQPPPGTAPGLLAVAQAAHRPRLHRLAARAKPTMPTCVSWPPATPPPAPPSLSLTRQFEYSVVRRAAPPGRHGLPRRPRRPAAAGAAIARGPAGGSWGRKLRR
ncbi:MAG: hypothetical protein WKG07_10485 [Hymenobacter sp.]